MINNIDKNKSLLYDADVILHFLSGDKLLDLFNIFPNKALIIDKVYSELSKSQRTKETIDNQIKLGLLTKVDFPSNPIIIKEYAHLRSSLMDKGEGESACMAYCKFTKDVIASSNLKDIKTYCTLHKIEYLTTMDFVVHAYETGLWNLNCCDDFIQLVVDKNHKLPCKNFSDYAKMIGLAISA